DIAGDDDLPLQRQLAQPGAELPLVVVERTGEVPDKDPQRADAAVAQVIANLKQRSRPRAAIDGTETADDDVAIRSRRLDLACHRSRCDLGRPPNGRRMRDQPALPGRARDPAIM